jgi:hypothetical protein
LTVKLACGELVDGVGLGESKRGESASVGGVPLEEVDAGGEVCGDGAQVQDERSVPPVEQSLAERSSREARSSNDDMAHIIGFSR